MPVGPAQCPTAPGFGFVLLRMVKRSAGGGVGALPVSVDRDTDINFSQPQPPGIFFWLG